MGGLGGLFGSGSGSNNNQSGGILDSFKNAFSGGSQQQSQQSSGGFFDSIKNTFSGGSQQQQQPQQESGGISSWFGFHE